MKKTKLFLRRYKIYEYDMDNKYQLINKFDGYRNYKEVMKEIEEFKIYDSKNNIHNRKYIPRKRIHFIKIWRYTDERNKSK